MTNNPTIDGVSRDPREWNDHQILDFIGVALRNVDPLGSVVLNEIRQGFKYMLDRAAPVVERQEWDGPFGVGHGAEAVAERQPLSFDPDEISAGPGGVTEVERLQATCDGLDSQNDALAAEVAALQSTITRLEAQLNNAIDLDFQRRERITQLESEKELMLRGAEVYKERIAELERGRGEAFGYWLSPKNEERQGMFARVTKEDDVVGSSSVNEFFNITPLFTAPPVPVASLWEIRIPDEPQNPESPAEYFYAQNAANRDLLLMREGATVAAEYARLDATAALNGPDK